MLQLTSLWKYKAQIFYLFAFLFISAHMLNVDSSYLISVSISIPIRRYDCKLISFE